MSESAIYFVVVFTSLLLAAGVGITFFEFRRGEAAGRAARAQKREEELTYAPARVRVPL